MASEIRSLGYELLQQVGCSGFRIDLGVLDPAEPGRFLFGVECDWATYHSAATARDRDRLRQQVREQLGWRIHRIWSPEWIQKRGLEIWRLKEAIEDARRGQGSTAELQEILWSEEDLDTVSPAPEFERVAVKQPLENAALPGTTPYQVSNVGSYVYDDPSFHNPEYREEQTDLLAQVVREEGPIHIDLATRRLLLVWGLTRAGSRITDAVAESIKRGERRSLFKKRGFFL